MCYNNYNKHNTRRRHPSISLINHKKFRCENPKATSSFFELFDEIEPKITNEKQKYYLNYAANIAMKSNMNHKHGAIIVYKKKIIATGFNYIINSYYNEFSIHAEISAISSIKSIPNYKIILQECELYVVRIGPKELFNTLKYSKPCCNCQKAINKYDIKKVFYSTNYEYDKINNFS
jgi:deoxycytidylate deaminase